MCCAEYSFRLDAEWSRVCDRRNQMGLTKVQVVVANLDAEHSRSGRARAADGGRF